MKIKIIHDPQKATGIAIIIDVFRAFTVEPIIIKNGAKKLIVIGDKEIAYNLKKENSNYILIGERGGIKLPNFDYGNSPSQIEKVDFTNKVVVHTTSCGTQGIVNSINAKEIITGSLVNISAIVKYIKNRGYDDISIVTLAKPGVDPFEEDKLCAEYIKAKLENKSTDEFNARILNLKYTSGAKFFDDKLQEIYPKKDFYLCIDIDKYDFVLKAKKDEEGYYYMEKILVE
jgi:hypothetical protein